MKTMYQLFIHELVDLSNAAHAFHDVLKRMSSAATDSDLKELLDTYYYQTEYQVKKLQGYLAERFDEDESDCLIAEAILEHSLGAMRYQGSTEIRDVALLITVNMIKHFETTAIGTLLAHAELLQLDKEIDLLTSVENKIAEDAERPLELAHEILSQVENEEEVRKLLGEVTKTHLADEEELLDWLPSFRKQVQSENLVEALGTYQKRHEEFREKMIDSCRDLTAGSEVEEWRVLTGFTEEWHEDLERLKPSVLKDAAALMTTQRIQHQNIALLEMEERLARRLDLEEAAELFKYARQIEEGNDQSFTAIAEGSLFEEGLHADL